MTKLRKPSKALAHMTEVAAMNVIKAPVITEKATSLTEANQYVFRVALDSNKFEIKAAIEKLFKVNVIGVNTIRVLGKTKRFRGRIGFRSDYKKAIVRLKEGQNIDLSIGA